MAMAPLGASPAMVAIAVIVVSVSQCRGGAERNRSGAKR
jgi:hypothetical protein